MSNRESIVLASFLARCGLASRRACAEMISAGKIAVNGDPVTDVRCRVDPVRDHVTCDGEPVVLQTHRYFVLHKPRGYTCSANDRHAERLVFELLPTIPDCRLFSVGRLDRDSEGLLLFTNDGSLAERLTHPRYQVAKIYEVVVNGQVTANGLAQLVDGINDDGEQLRATAATKIAESSGRCTLRITICDGKKREIRRMIRYLGGTVHRLVRTHFGPIALGSLPAGSVRELSGGEVEQLRSSTPTSNDVL